MSAHPPRRTGGDADRPFGASLTRKRSGGGPALSRTPCSTRRAADSAERETPEHGRAQRMQAYECELHLGLDTRRPDDPAPSAAADRCRSREVLSTPASPRRTRPRLWPARTPATSRSSTSRSRAQPSKPDREHAAGAPRHPAPRSQEAWQFGRHCVEQSRLRPRPSSRRRNLRRHTPSPRPALGGGRRRVCRQPGSVMRAGGGRLTDTLQRARSRRSAVQAVDAPGCAPFPALIAAARRGAGAESPGGVPFLRSPPARTSGPQRRQSCLVRDACTSCRAQATSSMSVLWRSSSA